MKGGESGRRGGDSIDDIWEKLFGRYVCGFFSVEGRVMAETDLSRFMTAVRSAAHICKFVSLYALFERYLGY